MNDTEKLTRRIGIALLVTGVLVGYLDFSLESAAIGSGFFFIVQSLLDARDRRRSPDHARQP